MIYGRIVLAPSSSIWPTSDGSFMSMLADRINNIPINHIQASDHTRAIQWPASLNSGGSISSLSKNSNREQSHHPILIKTIIGSLVTFKPCHQGQQRRNKHNLGVRFSPCPRAFRRVRVLAGKKPPRALGRPLTNIKKNWLQGI
mmetsp:Transcript_40194/g.72419  ORF Transcript_40194/g.72419 Transcript_40194/m.72419 type:complete len:144 (+) Transcript_40194:64-495(+)